MKWLLFLLGITLLYGACDGQTTTTKDVQTTASTDGPTTTSKDVQTTASTHGQTTTTKDVLTTASTHSPTTSSAGKGNETTPNPCEEVECEENAECNKTNGDCVCKEGYIKEDGTCQQVCSETTSEFNNDEVRYDVDCNDVVNYTKAEDYTTSFDAVIVGKSSQSNYTCEPCDGTGKRPIGVRTCVLGEDGTAVFSPPSFTNCSQTLGEQSTEEKTENALIYTSDPDTITDEQYDAAAEVVDDIAGQDEIPPEDAENAVEITNNLLQSLDSNADDEALSSLMGSLDEISSSVELTEDKELGEITFETTETTLAVAVVGDSPATSTARALADKTFYYGTDGNLASNLVVSGLGLNTSAPEGVFIAAKPTGIAGERLSFKIYTESDKIFPDLPQSESTSIVLSANGTANGTETGVEFEFNFILKNNRTLDSEGRFNVTEEDGKRTFSLKCVRYVRGKNSWDEAAACNTTSGENFYARCTCSEAGEYAMRKVDISVDDGLSPGAIAGIGIGTVVGVVLIGGCICNFCFCSKKKAKGAVSPS